MSRPDPVVAFLMLALCSTFALCSSFALADDKPQRQITTSGESTVYVQPDEAIVTLGVQSADSNLDRATARNDEAAASLVKQIKAMGIDNKDFSTGEVQVELRYQSNGTDVEAYTVRRMYMVTLKDLKKLEPLITSSLHSGANMLQGIEFRSTELRKHRDEARAMACKAAKEKADALAKELACTVGKPFTINEGGYGYYGPWNANSMAQNIAQSSPPAGAAEGGETMPLGQIAITANVSVTFDLVPQ